MPKHVKTAAATAELCWKCWHTLTAAWKRLSKSGDMLRQWWHTELANVYTRWQMQHHSLKQCWNTVDQWFTNLKVVNLHQHILNFENSWTNAERCWNAVAQCPKQQKMFRLRPQVLSHAGNTGAWWPSVKQCRTILTDVDKRWPMLTTCWQTWQMMANAATEVDKCWNAVENVWGCCCYIFVILQNIISDIRVSNWVLY